MIIFNNGSGTQTSDFTAQNYGIYNQNGFVHSGVADVTAAPGMKIYTRGGSIIVEAPVAGTVTVTSIDGRSLVREVSEGTNVLTDFAPGFYIVNTTKLYLR